MLHFFCLLLFFLFPARTACSRKIEEKGQKREGVRKLQKIIKGGRFSLPPAIFFLAASGREMKRKGCFLDVIEDLDRPCGAVLEGLDI